MYALLTETSFEHHFGQSLECSQPYRRRDWAGGARLAPLLLPAHIFWAFSIMNNESAVIMLLGTRLCLVPAHHDMAHDSMQTFHPGA